MKKGSYYRYALKILFSLSNREQEFEISRRCSTLAKKLVIPKTSFFEVLKKLEESEYISIKQTVHTFNTGFTVRYFSSLAITPKGRRFYVHEFNRISSLNV